MSGVRHATEDDTEDLLVVVIGWVNSEDSDVRKFKDIYRRSFTVISCALTSANIGDSSAIRHECVRTLEYGRSKLKRERIRVLFHVLGNTGARFFSQFEQLLRSSKYGKVYGVAGVVFDSCVRSEGLSATDEFQQVTGGVALSEAASRRGVLTQLRVTFWFLFAFLAFLRRILLRLLGYRISPNDKERLLEEKQARGDASSNDQSACKDDDGDEADSEFHLVPDWPELYLFSRADNVISEAHIRATIRSQMTERFAQTSENSASNSSEKDASKSITANKRCESQCGEVRYVCWDTTAHLKHLAEHEYTYTKNCFEFLESCISHGL